MNWLEKAVPRRLLGWLVSRVQFEGDTVHIQLEEDTHQTPVVLVFPEKTFIMIENEKERETGPNEEFMTKDYYSMDGMTTGTLRDDRYFKALGEPTSITPLKELTDSR